MLNKVISRRLFIGATTLVVAAPLLSAGINKKLALLEVEKDGQFFTAKELTLLSDVAEIMIPRTTTPGAYDAHVAIVLDALMISWAGKKTKKQFQTVLQQINTLAQNTLATDYIALPKANRVALIEELDKSSFSKKKTTLSVNYRRLKEMIFHLYYTSEEANPDFVLIPGQYQGNLTKAQYAMLTNEGLS